MKKLLSLLLMSVFALAAHAQMPKIAYLSYESALKSMPDYALVQQEMEDLRTQYDNELAAAEKEFSEKYELFLEQQATMVPAIREKRQSELQLLLERNVAFRAESQRLAKQAEADAMKPLQEKLNSTLAAIAEKEGFIVVVNTDSNACPYINPAIAVDINEQVANLLGN